MEDPTRYYSCDISKATRVVALSQGNLTTLNSEGWEKVVRSAVRQLHGWKSNRKYNEGNIKEYTRHVNEAETDKDRESYQDLLNGYLNREELLKEWHEKVWQAYLILRTQFEEKMKPQS